jgi:hypothetical protein
MGLVAALAGCYLLGLVTRLGMVTPPAITDPASVVPDEPVAATTKAGQATASAPGAVLPPDREPEIPAFVLERMAQSCEEDRSRLYRQAGDGYLADGDFKSAVHCYGRSLDAGSEQDWMVTKDDNWLLIHLKTARQEEKSYAKSAG